MAGITKGRPENSKIIDIMHTKTNPFASLTDGFCSAFRKEEQEIDPLNQVICFSTGISLHPSSEYRLRFLNNHNILGCGYQILDVADSTAENIYAIKFREGSDISSPFAVPYIVEKKNQRVNIGETVSRKEEPRDDYSRDYQPPKVYAPQSLNRWG